MLKGKELLDYTLDKINRKSKLHAIGELASQLLNFDEKHKMLLCLANKIDAYSDIRDAIKHLDEQMKGSIGDYIIASVAETKIMDVYPYKVQEA